jgi:hypothetical protein
LLTIIGIDKMINKRQKKTYLIDLYDDEAYSLGGWLKENAGNLFQTVAGGVLTATGLGAEVGIPMMVSGGAGLLGSATADKPDVIDYSNQTRMPRTVGTKNMIPNVMSFKQGGDAKVAKVMKEFKQGKLHSGSKKGPVVKNRKQAIAIALSEARLSKKANGGSLQRIEGPSHEQGGVQLMPNIEVEGGETIKNNVVNSDNWKITKQVAKIYNLRPASVGKTPAEYSKLIDDEYKKNENMIGSKKDHEIELDKISAMSAEMAEILGNESGKAENGERIFPLQIPDINIPNVNLGSYNNLFPARMLNRGINAANSILDYGTEFINAESRIASIPQRYVTNKLASTAIKGYALSHPRQYVDFTRWNNDKIPINPTITNRSVNNLNIGPDINSGNPRPGDMQFMPEIKVDTSMIGKPQTKKATGINIPAKFAEGQTLWYDRDNVKYTPPTGDEAALSPEFLMNQYVNNTASRTNPNIDFGEFTPDEISLPEIKTKNTANLKNIGQTALGLAPVAVNAFLAAKTAAEGPDKVKLPRLHHDPVNPKLIDPAYQVQQAKDSFATANEAMSQISKKDYLRRRIQSATEEGKVTSGIRGQADATNAQLLNQAEQINKESMMRTDAANLEAAMQEENINAANKGAWQTSRDFYISNLGTMAGEIGRDLRLEDANELYNDRLFNVMNEGFKPQGYTWDRSGNLIKISNGVSIPSTLDVNATSTNPHYVNPSDAAYRGAEIEGYANHLTNPYNASRKRFLQSYYSNPKGLY